MKNPPPCKPHHWRRLTAGYTLLEMMVTVAIIGILATFAVGKYQTYIERVDRRNAIANLMFIQQTLERGRLKTGVYSTPTELTTSLNSKIKSRTPYVYQVIVDETKNRYIATATVNKQTALVNEQAASVCNILRVSESDAKNNGATPSSNAYNDECWQ